MTPEAEGIADDDAPRTAITKGDLATGWRRLNAGPEAVELVAIGRVITSSAGTACATTSGRPASLVGADLGRHGS